MLITIRIANRVFAKQLEAPQPPPAQPLPLPPNLAKCIVVSNKNFSLFHFFVSELMDRRLLRPIRTKLIKFMLENLCFLNLNQFLTVLWRNHYCARGWQQQARSTQRSPLFHPFLLSS